MAVKPLVGGELGAPAVATAIGEVAGVRHAPRIELGGVLLDQVDLVAAVERLRGFLERPALHQIVTINLDFLALARRDQGFRETINQADLAVADGMPLVWMSRLKGRPLAERITGVELVDASCRIAAQHGLGVFLLGSTPDVAAGAALTLMSRYPGLLAQGYSPPFGSLSADDDARIVERITRARPSFLFVALGAPRQDLWIRAHREVLEVPVAMGVGCVLDLLAGVVRRAPGWMQKSGLEWSYRLLQEPQRLWRRYILDDMPMLGRLAAEAARERVQSPGTPDRHNLALLDR